MHEDDQVPPGVELELLGRFWQDHERLGQLQALEVYQKIFPRYPRGVAKAYEAFEAHGPRQALPLGVPERIGEYHILRVLGEGGMGVVYEARSPQGVSVALKVLRAGAATEQLLARLRREGRALAKLDHPYLARFLRAGEADGVHFIVMEFVPGESLAEFLERLRTEDAPDWSLRERVEFFRKITIGVQHAHQRGIYHRDLKPQNILVTRSEGESELLPKVIDFGLAKFEDPGEESLVSEQGLVLGTLPYMSPEQARGEQLVVHAQLDVFSLGAIFHEILTGFRRTGRTREEVLAMEFPRPSRCLRESDGAKALRGFGQSVEQLAARLEGDLDAVLAVSLFPDPVIRYGSVGEFRADLENYLEDRPLSVRPSRVAYRARKYLRRNRRALGALGVLILAASAIWGIAAAKAEFDLVRASREATKRGRGAEAGSIAASERAKVLRSRHAELLAVRPSYLGVWDYEDVLRCESDAESAQRDADRLAAEAEEAYQRALDERLAGKPCYLEAATRLARLRRRTFAGARLTGGRGLDAEFFRARLSSRARREIEEADRIVFSLRTEPPARELFVLRYEEFEGRLVPLPFDPVKQSLVETAPRLKVEYAGDPSRWSADPLYHVFQPGDRLLEAGGSPVHLPGELAKVLTGRRFGERVRVSIDRQGERVEKDWIPFREYFYDGYLPELFTEGHVLNFFLQFMLGFESAPLTLLPSCRLTSKTGVFSLDLPPGSYLLVAKHGEALTRYPVATPWRREERQLKVFSAAEIPPGFVPVPAGPFVPGGDPKVDQALPPDEVHVGDFFIATHEVTFGEYLEFLNDRSVGEDGLASPVAEWPKHFRVDGERPRVSLLPAEFSTQLVRHDDRWSIADAALAGRLERVPITGISYLAALEFAHWMTQKSPTWEFYLPSALEWEKVARGVDRRYYPWGRRFVPSFCFSLGAKFSDHLWPVGSFPVDESVYGARDLAGSVNEPTADLIVGQLASSVYAIYRGGSYMTPVLYYYRAANRNGYLAPRTRIDSGLRLAARLP